MSQPTCNNHFNPDWPSNSKYVTAVSATYASPFDASLCWSSDAAAGGYDCGAPPSVLGEVSVSLRQGLFWTTGGGVSDLISQPWYQKAAMAEYLSRTDIAQPPATWFNASNRAYGDVAALGHALLVFTGGKWGRADGTSASAPVFASVLALVQSERYARNMPALGLVNPLLYKAAVEHPSAFRDITVGNNACGDYSTGCCKHGYEACSGFDLVSGIL